MGALLHLIIHEDGRNIYFLLALIDRKRWRVFEGENDYKTTTQFIEEKFDQLNEDPHKMVYMHLTCATDTNQVQLVLCNTTDMIISENIKKTGVMWSHFNLHKQIFSMKCASFMDCSVWTKEAALYARTMRTALLSALTLLPSLTPSYLLRRWLRLAT